MCAAVKNGDEALVRLLLSGQTKVMPYVLNPRHVKHEHDLSEAKLREIIPPEPSSSAATVSGATSPHVDLHVSTPKAAGPPLPAPLSPGKRHQSQSTAFPYGSLEEDDDDEDWQEDLGDDVCKKTAEETDECLLHIAIQSKPPKVSIVTMLLDYNPDAEDIRRQRSQDDLKQYVSNQPLFDRAV